MLQKTNISYPLVRIKNISLSKIFAYFLFSNPLQFSKNEKSIDLNNLKVLIPQEKTVKLKGFCFSLMKDLNPMRPLFKFCFFLYLFFTFFEINNSNVT